jgi:hypothetical protein
MRSVWRSGNIPVVYVVQSHGLLLSNVIRLLRSEAVIFLVECISINELDVLPSRTLSVVRKMPSTYCL